MDAVRILEDEIREIVRRQGIDPQREHARVLTLIQDAAADYESRAMVSSLPDLEDPVAARQDLFDRIAGLGPLQRLMDDPSVEEIWNGKTCLCLPHDSAIFGWSEPLSL